MTSTRIQEHSVSRCVTNFTNSISFSNPSTHNLSPFPSANLYATNYSANRSPLCIATVKFARWHGTTNLFCPLLPNRPSSSRRSVTRSTQGQSIYWTSNSSKLLITESKCTWTTGRNSSKITKFSNSCFLSRHKMLGMFLYWGLSSSTMAKMDSLTLQNTLLRICK